jgi:hypothetical protein
MKVKKVLSIMMVLLLAVSVLTFSDTTLTKIEAYFAESFNFRVNGEAWAPKDVDGSPLTPIVYNGRTYVPVRSLLEDQGVKVEWEGDTSTVVLDYSTMPKRIDKSSPLLMTTLMVDNSGGGAGKATFKELTLAKNPNLDTGIPMDLEYAFDIQESTIVYLNGERLDGELLKLKEMNEFGVISSVKLGVMEDNTVAEVYLYNDPDSDGDGIDDMIESRASIEIDIDISGPPFKIRIVIRIRF